jgi:hypothetical protein
MYTCICTYLKLFVICVVTIETTKKYFFGNKFRQISKIFYFLCIDIAYTDRIQHLAFDGIKIEKNNNRKERRKETFLKVFGEMKHFHLVWMEGRC